MTSLRRLGAALIGICAIALQPLPAQGEETPAPRDKAAGTSTADRFFHPEEVRSTGSVTIGGKAIAYDAIAGTLVVHAQGWDDVAWRETSAKKDDDKGDGKDAELPPAEASMFYAAYFKRGAPAADRPITFLYNGGPGSATVWLHMGAFGPRKIVTSDGVYTPAAPYGIVNNADSLLDASDLVFIDAPGTGWSRVAGKDKDKAFFGVDEDAHAFGAFIKAFLTKYDRWNSPRYLFGESYGTPRTAVVTQQLQSDELVQFNGIMLLSQILNFDLSVDDPGYNPAIDLPYITALPTMTATAWYHNRLSPRPAELEPLLREVERFATTDYAAALAQGSELAPEAKAAMAAKLSQYTGLPADFIMRANLRVDGGTFSQQLLNANGEIVGRLDSRFHGPASDVLDKRAKYDPLDPALGSAYVSALHDYASRSLNWRPQEAFKLQISPQWDYRHQPPGAGDKIDITTNVMPDLADAMKQNPGLKVLLLGGYYDLGTPYFEGVYEMHHLPIPQALQQNITYRYFKSGHMVYANPESARELHEAAAAFIRSTSRAGG